jgi:mRNA-degrading endonuclease RelE of RelBE toxin-antitoxin system
MKIACTEILRDDCHKLPAAVRKAAAKQITQLLIDCAHPSLKLEGIRGRKGLFSVRIDERYRISLMFTGEDTILLRRVLDHEDLYRKP